MGIRFNTRYSPTMTARQPWQCADFVGAALGHVLDDKFPKAHSVVYEHERYTHDKLPYHPPFSTQKPPADVPAPDAPHALWEEERDIQNTLALAETARLLRIVGDVGVGKSTFVKHLVEEHFPTTAFGSPVPIYLDWSNFTAPSSDPLPEIYKRFHRSVYAALESAFAKAALRAIDYEVFETDLLCATARAELEHVGEESRRERRAEILAGLIKTDPVQFAYARVNALSRENVNHFVIIFDNIDHLRPQVLAGVLEFANEVRRAVVSLVIIAVRDHTAVRSSSYLPEAAVPSWTMRLYPPIISAVLSRRLDHFFPEVYDPKKHSHVESLGKQLKLRDTTEAVAICRALLESPFLNKSTCAFVNRWSNYSIRELFKILQQLLHFYGLEAKGAQLLLTKKPFEMTVDDVLTALALERHQIFYPSRSKICNVYSSGEDHSATDRLVGVRLLQFLRPHTYPQKWAGVRERFQSWGYSVASLDRQLAAMLAKDVLWSSTGSPDDFDEKESFVRLSYRGNLYVELLLSRVTYNYAMSFDVVVPPRCPDHLARHFLLQDDLAELALFADLAGALDIESVVGRVLGLAELQLEAELSEWENILNVDKAAEFHQAFGALTSSTAIAEGLSRFLSAIASKRDLERRGGLPSVEVQEAVVSFQERLSAERASIVR